jgi:hypothetical protein
LRNQAAVGAYAWLSTNGGVTLYDAQGPQADGSSNQEFLAELEEDSAFAALGEAERDAWLQRAALNQMRADPGRAVRLAGVKLRRMWNPRPNVAEHARGAAALAVAMYSMVVTVGALIGLVHTLLARRGSPRRVLHALLWVSVVYFAVLHSVYIGSVRYRVPLMPLLVCAAATVLVARRPASAKPAAGVVDSEPT